MTLLLVAGFFWWSLIGTRQAAASDLPVVQEGKLADFLDSIGICAHLTDTNSTYRNLDLALQQMQRLGIHHVRDDVRGGADRQAAIMQAAHAKGIGTTLIIMPERLPQTDPNLQWLLRNRNALDAIEGRNELDNNHGPLDFEREGRPLYQGVNDYMSSLRIRLGQAGMRIPFLSFTMVHEDMLGRVAAMETHSPQIPYDIEAVHLYDKDGSGPAVALPHELSMFRRSPKPMMVTETGYTTINWTPGNDRHGGRMGVNERVQAFYILRTFLESYRLGSRRTFVYQLQDAAAYPADVEKEAHFGFFTADGRAKPAAIALANMLKALRSLPTAGTSPTPIIVTPNGAVHALRLTWGNGQAATVVWRADSLWDGRAHHERVEGFQPIQATLQLPEGAPAGLTAIDLSNGQHVAVATNGKFGQFALGPSPVILLAKS